MKYETDIDIDGVAQSDSFITNGGTSSDFVKGDGSLDSTDYLPSSGIIPQNEIVFGGASGELDSDAGLKFNDPHIITNYGIHSTTEDVVFGANPYVIPAQYNITPFSGGNAHYIDADIQETWGLRYHNSNSNYRWIFDVDTDRTYVRNDLKITTTQDNTLTNLLAEDANGVVHSRTVSSLPFADDSDVVHISGSETITGEKTFTNITHQNIAGPQAIYFESDTSGPNRSWARYYQGNNYLWNFLLESSGDINFLSVTGTNEFRVDNNIVWHEGNLGDAAGTGLNYNGSNELEVINPFNPGDYYTQTQIDNFFSGSTAITGYNKSNWDTAFSWGDHSTQGYLTSVAFSDIVAGAYIDSNESFSDVDNQLMTAAAIDDLIEGKGYLTTETQDLQGVLTNGDSAGNNTIRDLDSILFHDNINNFDSEIENPILSADRTLSLPDASGTFALTSDVNNYDYWQLDVDSSGAPENINSNDILNLIGGDHLTTSFTSSGSNKGLTFNVDGNSLAGSGLNYTGTSLEVTSQGLTNEEVEDIVGGMVTGNTENLITVNYVDNDGTLDFQVDDDLSQYDNSTSGFLTSTDISSLEQNDNEVVVGKGAGNDITTYDQFKWIDNGGTPENPLSGMKSINGSVTIKTKEPDGSTNDYSGGTVYWNFVKDFAGDATGVSFDLGSKIDAVANDLDDGGSMSNAGKFLVKINSLRTFNDSDANLEVQEYIFVMSRDSSGDWSLLNSITPTTYKSGNGYSNIVFITGGSTVSLKSSSSSNSGLEDLESIELYFQTTYLSRYSS